MSNRLLGGHQSVRILYNFNMVNKQLIDFAIVLFWHGNCMLIGRAPVDLSKYGVYVKGAILEIEND